MRFSSLGYKQPSSSATEADSGNAKLESISIQMTSSVSHQSKRLRNSPIWSTKLTGNMAYILLFLMGIYG